MEGLKLLPRTVASPIIIPFSPCLPSRLMAPGRQWLWSSYLCSWCIKKEFWFLLQPGVFTAVVVIFEMTHRLEDFYLSVLALSVTLTFKYINKFFFCKSES